MAGWELERAAIEEQMKWGVLFALLLAFLTAFRDVASMNDRGDLAVWFWSLAAQLTLFLFWGLAAPAVLHAMDWMRRTRCSRWKAVTLHLGLYGLLGSVFYAFVALVNVVIWPMPGRTESWDFFYKGKTFSLILLNSALKYYLPVLLGGALYAYYRGMREEELKASQLREQLSESQFRLLKAQLHPHFLFNTLHSISTLVYTDPARADRMIAQLSDLLRLSLETTDVVMVPLQEELQYVSKYLDIERTRFSDRLVTQFSVEPGTLSVDVPNLILQPLVENAIKHGTSKLTGGGRIEIKASKQRGGLVLAVEDNGPGFRKNGDSAGVGTRNVRERLVRLYTHRARLTMKNLHPQGARQELFIPIDDVSALFESPSVEMESAS